MGFAPKEPESTQRRKSDFKDYIPIEKIQRYEWFQYSKPLDLNYKEDSSRADTKIQILLLPKGSNSETFREERLVSKKKCMIRNIINPHLGSALLTDMFCNKNNAISLEAIMGETTTVPT